MGIILGVIGGIIIGAVLAGFLLLKGLSKGWHK